MTPERVDQIWKQAIKISATTFECRPRVFARLLANEVKEGCAQTCEKVDRRSIDDDKVIKLLHDSEALACAEAIRATKEV